MLLEVKNLDKSFDGVKAVQNCNFNIEENKIIALIGPNGAGKTTVFNLITGFIKPDKGHIHFKGEPIDGLFPYQIANLGLARTFQLIRLFPKLTALENLLLAKHKEADNLIKTIFNPKFIRHEEKTNKERCKEFLKIVGLEDKENVHAENLSYGQQKLLEIARILATEANLLLIDEPVAGVNPVMREKIKDVLLKLKKEGKTILFIEHDMKFVMGLADKVIVMDYGQEIAIGTAKQIQNNPKVLEAYLGKKVKL
ncbi:ABC transporter ATP-binding protein [Candidatus Woesearchaeota archaeon]|nr:ABC transporter ATP-binding protein [Candidatus Woesearchaeota archaeon]